MRDLRHVADHARDGLADAGAEHGQALRGLCRRGPAGGGRRSEPRAQRRHPARHRRVAVDFPQESRYRDMLSSPWTTQGVKERIRPDTPPSTENFVLTRALLT